MKTVSSPSSAFRISQEGYSSARPVRIAVLCESPLTLKDAFGNEILSWPEEPLLPDESSGDRLRLLEPGILPEGRYTLESHCESRSFTVSARPWQSVTNALIKGLYYQRCGCELCGSHAGVWRHSACHTAPAVDWEDRSIRIRVSGGWHDAGDYGKYTGPGAVTVAHLLYAWLLFPEGCSDALNIPESGNGLPDILNEARYELDWLLQMQRSDGAFHHKLTKAHFAPFIMPEEDRGTEYLMPVSHCATGAACACLALAARVYRAFDVPFANHMLLSALRGWQWLEEHPDFEPFNNPEGVRTGQYGDGSDSDERFWAACELLAATGENRFREAAEKLYAAGQHLTGFGWANVAGLGAVCCLFSLKEKAGSILFTSLKESFLRECEGILALSRASGYGTALAPDQYIWGSILPVMSGAMAMILHFMLTGQQEMREAALLQWYYALGLNALDTCFITGFGEKSVMHPHHRPSGADEVEAPVPGLISGGPNKRYTYPATREKLGEDTPPAKYFLDEMSSADTNEIAIYWNSPAIFTAAFFNSPSVN